MEVWIHRLAVGLCLFNCIWFSRLAFQFLEMRIMRQFWLSVVCFIGSAAVVLGSIGQVV